MPTIQIFGIKVRVRPMLDALAAQEWVEYVAGSRPSPTRFTAQAAHDKRYDEATRKRNRARTALRPNEQRAFLKWCDGDIHIRESTLAILTDLPPVRLRKQV